MSEQPDAMQDIEGNKQPPPTWGRDWLGYTETHHYNRVRDIMLEYKMGEGDVEMILANVWESGWMAGNHNREISP